MTIETQHDLDGLRRVGGIVAAVLQEMLDTLAPGITTAELDGYFAATGGTADGWTLVGAKDNLSAQHEHTLIVTRAEPIVLTQSGL